MVVTQSYTCEHEHYRQPNSNTLNNNKISFLTQTAIEDRYIQHINQRGTQVKYLLIVCPLGSLKQLAKL